MGDYYRYRIDISDILKYRIVSLSLLKILWFRYNITTPTSINNNNNLFYNNNNNKIQTQNIAAANSKTKLTNTSYGRC